ncbi:MAG: hypothetical protein V5A34_08930 [Halapricum sp.]
MADLSSNERGQIILILAFALAVIFVALALILNSVIFTENLASRGDTSGGTDALETRVMIEQSIGADLASTNRLNHSNLEAAIQANINETSRQIERSEVISGVLLNISYNSSTEGSRINQSDSTREFTAADGSEDWAVVQDVERPGSGENATRAFQLNVTKSALADSETDAFRVNVTEYNGVDSWEVRIWNETSNTVNISVASGSSDVECTPETHQSNVRIDLTSGTVDNKPCRALRINATSGDDYRFASGVGSRYNISFRNGDEAAGTYSLVTRNASVDGSSSLLKSPGDGQQPHVTEALYAVTATLQYRTSTLEYITDIRVAPGEPDE